MDAPGRVPTAINCHKCSQVVDLEGLGAFSEAECPYCHAPLVVPVEFGNFLLLHEQGAGGMGTVYRALDMALHRHVALKILKPSLAVDPKFIESFSREARAAAAVTHINCAQVYTFGEQNGHYFIAMELLEKGSLDDRIIDQGKLPEAAVLDIGAQIAAGLGAAYEQGLLHRDVKPGNILFDVEGIPKVVDFGLARGRGTTEEPRASADAPRLIWGTPYYIAPEKMRGQTDDLRSDIYSLGATLFHALAGRPPFEAATATDVAVKHTTQPVVSLKAFVPGIQDATARTIGRMLAKNPAERHHSYAELIADLEAAKAALRAAAAQPVVVTQTGEQVSMKSVYLTLATLAVVVVLIVAAVVFRKQIFGGVSPPPTTVTPAPPKPVVPVTPPEVEVTFKIEMPWGKLWHVAGAEAGQGNLEQSQKAYEGVRRQVRELPGHQPWVDCYEGLVLLGFEKDAEAMAAFARATNGLNSTELPATITTTNFIGLVAAGMVDTTVQATLERAGSRLPVWANSITFLGWGLKHLQAGDLPRAADGLHGYERLPYGESRAWVFVLQPLAARLAGECDLALKALTESAKQQKQNKPEDALATIRAALKVAQLKVVQAKLREREAELQKAVDEFRAQQERERQRAAAAKRAAEERQAAEEAQLIQTIEPAICPLWSQWDFAGAAAKYAEAGKSLQSPSAKARLEQRGAVMKVLAELKDQLVADLARKPYEQGDLVSRQNVPFTGKLMRANGRELVFTLAQGEMVAAWSDFPPPMLRKLADYYAQALGPSDRPELAGRRPLRLAVFCKQFGLEQFVTGYAQQAIQQQAALMQELDSLLAGAANQ
jgi:hypothetical protein